MGADTDTVSPLARIARWVQTVRHLRWEQVVWRLWYHAYRPRVDKRPVPSPQRICGEWVMPARRPPSLVGKHTFRFLNHEGTVEAAADWNDPAQEKLWLYNLHYFDDLNAENADERQVWHQDLIERWLAETLPGTGNGWEPYPTSLRVVNWIKWFLTGNRPPAGSLEDLSGQVRWLSKHLEYHILGNHLFANAKALVFAGEFFEGSEAGKWAEQGRALIQRELAEQVLEDGGHFERSPMYQLTILEDLLDLVNLSRAYGSSVPEAWNQSALRMLWWSSELQHPDGEVPFFNDAAIGVAPPPEEVIAYARRLGFERAAGPSAGTQATLFRDSGYAKLANPDCTAFFDVAPVGPDYLPAHAHADTLSIEVSVGSQRVLVNSGTSVYGTGPERHRQRSTASHNTVEIDGGNSSDVWSGFRVARRAHPRDVQVHSESSQVTAWHDGYCHLPGKPCHHREVCLDDRAVRIKDRVTGSFAHTVVGRFHLHPEVSTKRLDLQENGARVTLGRRDGGSRETGGGMALVIVGPVSVTLERTTYHPEFGLSIPSESVVFSYQGELPCEVITELRW